MICHDMLRNVWIHDDICCDMLLYCMICYDICWDMVRYVMICYSYTMLRYVIIKASLMVTVWSLMFKRATQEGCIFESLMVTG